VAEQAAAVVVGSKDGGRLGRGGRMMISVGERTIVGGGGRIAVCVGGRTVEQYLAVMIVCLKRMTLSWQAHSWLGES